MSAAVMVTACRRPEYFKRALDSWLAADVRQMDALYVALGPSDVAGQMHALIADFGDRAGIPVPVLPDSPAAIASNGVHRAYGEALANVFSRGHDMVIATEEDIVVSSDVLSYFRWADQNFRGEPAVLDACAHNQCGQGWDPHAPAQDQDADQDAVHLLPYFNAWCWATWKDRWPVLEAQWDWDCNNGSLGYDSGWDWQIHARTMPRGGFVSVVPAASRSQNIGELGGWSANAASWSFSQAQSFRDTRVNVTYRLTG